MTSEGAPPGLQTIAVSLSSHMTFPGCVLWKEKDLSFSYKITNPMSNLMASFIPIFFLQPLSANMVTLKDFNLTYKF